MTTGLTIKITQAQQVPVKYLKVDAGVRCWEDGTVNGAPDADDAPTIPCRSADNKRWAPVIDLDEGRILDWPEGVTASVHYKVCDDGIYDLLSEDMARVVTLEGYVPEILAPKGDGFGDYIIMNIDGAGKIDKWKVTLGAFEGAKGDDQ